MSRRRSDAGAAWSVERAARLYGVADWSQGYFEVAASGRLVARPDPDGATRVDLVEVVESLRRRGLRTPVLLRFPDILAHRVGRLHRAFALAREENDYRGELHALYPIKVNQQRTVVEEVLGGRRQMELGLEVGSKPELLAAMAASEIGSGRLVVCNGFKDAGYLEAAVLAIKTGHELIPVVEKAGELEPLLEIFARHQVAPRLGARLKLTSPSTGRWRDSSGERSKFGLTVSELVELFDRLRRDGRESALVLLHCHPGSQVQDIRRLRDGLSELARIYVEMVRLGASGLAYLDVGGGLGVDYRGRRANLPSTMNYDLEEYAETVVYSVGSVCDQAEVEHPHLVTESGRAMVAHHGVLVFDVLGSSAAVSASGDGTWPSLDELLAGEEAPLPLQTLAEVPDWLDRETLSEAYHAAADAWRESVQLFKLGYLSLPLRGHADRLFQRICVEVRRLAGELPAMPEELEELEGRLQEIYFCNLSVFQSLPDSWAIRQIFPVMPIHRLDEPPGHEAVLADLTCDSDGRLDRFPAGGSLRAALPVHPLVPGERYYLAAFLVGAYQETLGDLHNLFGDTHVAVVRLDPERAQGWECDVAVEGDRAREVLGYVGHDPEALARRFREHCRRAVERGALTREEEETLCGFYRGALDGYTYLQ